ncbi:MAG TPA: hypothetical protein VIM23_13430 [Gaiellaceae bacterium]|jgi:DNA-directed RNA polymerase subunit RPC12/RpoP
MAEPVRCGQCRTILEEPPNVPRDERLPCPKCGSRTRLYSQPLEARVTATATLVPTLVVATGAAAAYAVAKILVPPRAPEPGFHPPHRQGDLVGESILFGLGVAGLVAVGRGVRRRWESTFRL